MKECPFCFNAYVHTRRPREMDNYYDGELTDANDFSSSTIGASADNICMYLNSGNEVPTNIEVCKWVSSLDDSPHTGRWHTVAKYYPKFCPECGRKLDEYTIEDRGSTFKRVNR